jgi:hypothetical protein
MRRKRVILRPVIASPTSRLRVDQRADAHTSLLSELGMAKQLAMIGKDKLASTASMASATSGPLHSVSI